MHALGFWTVTISFASLTSRHWALPLAVSLLCLQGGCKKNPQGNTQTPTAPAQSDAPQGEGQPTEGSSNQEAPAQVEQIADPELLLQASSHYWKGQYEDLVSKLESAQSSWNAPNQQRALGLAHGWIALAHAEQLPENAQTHVESAQEIANKIEDQDVLALAKIASALSLVGMSQAEEAHTMLAQIPTPRDMEIERLLYIAQAKTEINMAFDAQERLAHPEKLVEAEQNYRKVQPHEGPHSNAVMGHVHEGMAAIAKFRGQSKHMCEQAKKAYEAYKEGEASELLQSGPMQMMHTGGCK